jgi:hypothetical protein
MGQLRRPIEMQLPDDCLRSTEPNQRAIHVPFGKRKTERMVPVNAFGRDRAHLLRFFRSLDLHYSENGSR